MAEKIVYGAFETIRDKTKRDPMDVLSQALNNVMPLIEVRPRRVGGANYQVPMEVRPDRSKSLGLRWLVSYAQGRPGRDMVDKLAQEIMDAANGTGGAVKKKKTRTEWLKLTKLLLIIVGFNRRSGILR